MLTVTFVVAKAKQLVMAQGAAQGRAEIIALKLRYLRLVEIVTRIQCAVAQKFVCRAVELVSS
jgi:hypothetical protein